MIDAVIRWSLRNRPIVAFATLLLLTLGVREAFEMPVDVFPDLTAPTVTVLVEGHGVAPEELELRVTRPMENALNGATGVRRVRSATGNGIVVMWVEFDWGTDILRARQVVDEKLALTGGDLPTGVDEPVLAPVSSIMGEVMFVGLTSDQHSLMELRHEADWTVRQRLMSVSGVSQVTPMGGERKQLHVILRPDRMRDLRVGIDEVIEALAQSNDNVSPGLHVEGGEEHVVHSAGRILSKKDAFPT